MKKSAPSPWGLALGNLAQKAPQPAQHQARVGRVVDVGFSRGEICLLESGLSKLIAAWPDGVTAPALFATLPRQLRKKVVRKGHDLVGVRMNKGDARSLGFMLLEVFAVKTSSPLFWQAVVKLIRAGNGKPGKRRTNKPIQKLHRTTLLRREQQERKKSLAQLGGWT